MKKILFALFTFSLLLSGCAQKIEAPSICRCMKTVRWEVTVS